MSPVDGALEARGAGCYSRNSIDVRFEAPGVDNRCTCEHRGGGLYWQDAEPRSENERPASGMNRHS